MSTKVTQEILPFLREAVAPYPVSQRFVLMDTNTVLHCWPLVAEAIDVVPEHLIVVPAGDEHKTIYTAIGVWEKLSALGATRNSLLLNIGGGMITDLGGFVASTFKRGLSYVNLSTTLLGAVDAATGGKTGVNLNGLKNEIGVFKPAEEVIVGVPFFKTLSGENLISGYAEMVKHALIATEKDWKEALALNLNTIDWAELEQLLVRNIQIKEQIVEQDPTEKGIRKALNFGHTIGHAIETLSHRENAPVLHGYAILWGAVAELYLSVVKLGFPKAHLSELLRLKREFYGDFPFTCKAYESLFELMTHDKKNHSKEINFTLLKGIGQVVINQTATKEEIFEALDFVREN